MTHAVTFRRPPRLSGRVGAIVAVAVAVPLAAGCGAGKGNETDKIRATPYNASADAGSMAVRGIRVVPTTGGETAGYLLAAVVNRGKSPDTLTNATVSGGAVTPNGISGFTVEPSHSLSFTTPEVGGPDTPTLTITTSPDPLTVGTTVPVTFTFENAGTVEVQVPVKSPEQVGSTATAEPIATTGSYPTPSTGPSESTEEP